MKLLTSVNKNTRLKLNPLLMIPNICICLMQYSKNIYRISSKPNYIETCQTSRTWVDPTQPTISLDIVKAEKLHFRVQCEVCFSIFFLLMLRCFLYLQSCMHIIHRHTYIHAYIHIYILPPADWEKDPRTSWWSSVVLAFVICCLIISSSSSSSFKACYVALLNSLLFYSS